MRQSLVSRSVVRSSPLSAYLDSDDDPPTPPEFDREAFVDEWCEVFGSEAELSYRLGFADHTLDSAREQFESAVSVDPDEVPSPFETAERVVDRAVEYDREAVNSLVDRRADSPFAHLLAPLAAAASERVQFDKDFTPGARESLIDWLFDRLTEAFGHPLFIQFKAHQRTEYPDTDFDECEDSTAVYDEFVEHHLDAGYERVFETYPVLLRLLGVVVEQWCGAVRRTVDRITTDRADLARTFNGGDDLGRVADVETLSDDPHADGEVVLGVHFERDCSVVYTAERDATVVRTSRSIRRTKPALVGPTASRRQRPDSCGCYGRDGATIAVANVGASALSGGNFRTGRRRIDRLFR